MKTLRIFLLVLLVPLISGCSGKVVEAVPGLSVVPLPESVSIGDGVFQGLEGYYQRIEGKRQKRFIVKIEDFIACAALIVDCNFIKLPKGK